MIHTEGRDGDTDNQAGFVFGGLFPWQQGDIAIHGGAVRLTRLPAISVSDHATESILININNLYIEDVATASSLCDDSAGCLKKGGYPVAARNVPVSLLWRPDHPRSWDQGSVSITGLTVVDTVARPWLQVLGHPGWHDLAIEAAVVNPHGCTQMLQPNTTAWKGASGLIVNCTSDKSIKGRASLKMDDSHLLVHPNLVSTADFRFKSDDFLVSSISFTTSNAVLNTDDAAQRYPQHVAQSSSGFLQTDGAASPLSGIVGIPRCDLQGTKENVLTTRMCELDNHRRFDQTRYQAIDILNARLSRWHNTLNHKMNVSLNGSRKQIVGSSQCSGNAHDRSRRLKTEDVITTAVLCDHTTLALEDWSPMNSLLSLVCAALGLDNTITSTSHGNANAKQGSDVKPDNRRVLQGVPNIDLNSDTPMAELISYNGHSLLQRKELGTLRGHSSSVDSLPWSPHGATLASGSADNTIKLWSVAQRKELGTLRAMHSVIPATSICNTTTAEDMRAVERFSVGSEIAHAEAREHVYCQNARLLRLALTILPGAHTYTAVHTVITYMLKL